MTSVTWSLSASCGVQCLPGATADDRKMKGPTAPTFFPQHSLALSSSSLRAPRQGLGDPFPPLPMVYKVAPSKFVTLLKQDWAVSDFTSTVMTQQSALPNVGVYVFPNIYRDPQY